jgi:uncharacterized membrane protein YhaH (DUF805 family)
MKLVESWKRVVLENYANFSGRASLGEYWWFTLASIVIAVVATILGSASTLFSVLLLLYALAVFIPSLGVGVRRLHDTNRSGWWYLIAFIPFGFIVLLVFLASQGTAGPNNYGPPPEPV